MSNLNNSIHDGAECGSAIGVIKFSFKKTGYPEVLKIANEWAKDPNFYQVIIRKVSQDDFGIQFVYYNREITDSKLVSDFRKVYIDPLKESLYAYDIAYSSGKEEKALEGIIKNVPIK